MKWKDVHYEHIVSISVIYNDLKKLKDKCLPNVKAILEQGEIIILSKEEALVLDGSPNKEYMLNGKYVKGLGLKASGYTQERLNAVGAEIDERYRDNLLW